jgi:hypothetical protein
MKSYTFGIIPRDKKGSLVDPILSSAYILKIVVVIFIALTIWFGFSNIMSTTISGTPVNSILAPIISDLSAAYLSIDYMFPFLVGGLIILSTIFAFKTGSNILWGILSIILWAIAWLMATVFTNVYISVSNQFQTLYAQLPIMDAIMMNMRWVALGWIAIISLVMFRKNNAEDEASEISRRAYGV